MSGYDLTTCSGQGRLVGQGVHRAGGVVQGKDEGSIFVTRSGGQLAGVVVLIMYATVRCGKGIVKLCSYDDEEDEEEGHAGLHIAEGVKGRQRVGGWDGWDGTPDASGVRQSNFDL